ncbi:MAG: hypothetical protein ACP5VS_05795 [Desulfomonilaceae bacterium]
MMRILMIVVTMGIFLGIACLANAGDESLGPQIEHMEKLVAKQHRKQEAEWKALEKEMAHFLGREYRRESTSR